MTVAVFHETVLIAILEFNLFDFENNDLQYLIMYMSVVQRD